MVQNKMKITPEVPKIAKETFQFNQQHSNVMHTSHQKPFITVCSHRISPPKQIDKHLL